VSETTLKYFQFYCNLNPRSEEIVMPAEQVGQVREQYMWRVLQRRSQTPEGRYWAVPSPGWNDRDLFCVIWGPLTAALHYVINKTEDETILAVSN
jgi:golgi-specific brefeldin A-resistance guanine nucleotide exchange factor 1